MSLQRRLGAVERQAQAAGLDGAESLPLAEQRRRAILQAALELVLSNMPVDRALRVVEELNAGPPADGWSPITQRVLQLAWSAVPRHGVHEWPPGVAPGPQVYGRNGPLTLPEAVCALLDAHPNAEFDWHSSCATCGYESGNRTLAEWGALARDAGPGRPCRYAYFEVCPVCGGRVGESAYHWAHGWSALPRGAVATHPELARFHLDLAAWGVELAPTTERAGGPQW